MRTIVVQDRQSMLDVALQGTGSLEAAMIFCRDNNVSITDDPIPGAEMLVSDEAIAAGAPEVVSYLEDEGIVLSTMGLSAGDGLLSEDERGIETEDGDQLVAE